jgi:hypothetical protein
MWKSEPWRGLWGRFLSAGFAVLMTATSATLVAQEDKSERIDPDAAERLKELKSAAESYVIERQSDPTVRLKLTPEPVLRWNNPLRVAYDGAVFVWVADGRPEVVASFYRNVQRGMPMEHHEFQSISESSLTAQRDGRTKWTPRSPGVQLKPIPGAPTPADSAAARSRQIHALARDFHAGYGTEQKSKGLSLRMLTKPLLRYETSRGAESDGALMAFVQATDPEALLLIESRSSGGAAAWHYAFAPMSARGLRGWYKDELVWEVPVLSSKADSPYVSINAPVQPR